MGEGLVGVEEAVPAGQQIALLPADEGVLGEHLHHPAVARQLATVRVFRQQVGHPDLLAHLVDRLQPIGGRLVGPEHAEVGHVVAHHVAQELAQRLGVLVQHLARLLHLDRIVAEVRQLQVPAQQAAVGVRVGAHAAAARGGERTQLRHQPAVGVEQFLWLVALHPVFQQLQMLGIGAHVRERHLVRAPRALCLVAVDLLGTGPALGRAQHDHRPARPLGLAAAARGLLDAANIGDRRIERGRHRLVHLGGVRALDEMRLVAVPDEQRLELLVADAREDGRVGDLVAVEVEDRQHRAVAERIDELVRVPGGRERAGLGLSVADHAGHDEIGVVEAGAIGMRQAVAQLAALVDGPGGFRGDVRADLAGEGELLEELAHSLRVFALVRVDLRVGAFEIGRAEHARRAVPGAGHEDDVEIVALDQAIEVQPDERQRRARSPVAEQAMLDVLDLQRFSEQRVAAQVDHADGQVIAGAPPGVEPTQLFGAECANSRRFCCGCFGHC